MSAATGAVPSSLVAMATCHVAEPCRRELEQLWTRRIVRRREGHRRQRSLLDLSKQHQEEEEEACGEMEDYLR